MNSLSINDLFCPMKERMYFTGTIAGPGEYYGVYEVFSWGDRMIS